MPRYIDAEQLVDNIKSLHFFDPNTECTIGFLIDLVNQAPEKIPFGVSTGKWKHLFDGKTQICECPICEAQFGEDKYDFSKIFYCPNCGSKNKYL